MNAKNVKGVSDFLGIFTVFLNIIMKIKYQKLSVNVKMGRRGFKTSKKTTKKERQKLRQEKEFKANETTLAEKIRNLKLTPREFFALRFEIQEEYLRRAMGPERYAKEKCSHGQCIVCLASSWFGKLRMHDFQ
jgi:hypothetical protein